MNTLPEEWQIKITEENKEILKPYWESLPNVDWVYEFKGYLLSYSHDRTYLSYSKTGAFDCPEITLEDFKNLVLKQTPSTKYKVGDTVSVPGGITSYYKNASSGEYSSPATFSNSFTSEITVIDGAYCQFGVYNGWFKLSDLPKKENMNEKKIIGYKLKEEFNYLKETAAKIGQGRDNIVRLTEQSEYLKTGIIKYAGSTRTIQNLKDVGVLDLWFEPVFAPEKPKETILHLGDKKTEVIIGQKKIMADGKGISRDDVSELLRVMGGNSTFSDMNWTVEFPLVKVGCTTLTIDEINLILITYDKLNP